MQYPIAARFITLTLDISKKSVDSILHHSEKLEYAGFDNFHGNTFFIVQ